MDIRLLRSETGDLSKRLSVRISKAGKEQQELLQAAQGIERKTFPSSEQMDLEAELKRANTSLLCICDHAVRQRGVVAYLVYTRAKATVLLHKLCVRSDCRRRGLGSSVLGYLIDHARMRNCSSMQLWVDEKRHLARKLYAVNGFRETGIVEDYYGPGRRGLRMVLELEVGRLNAS